MKHIEMNLEYDSYVTVQCARCAKELKSPTMDNHQVNAWLLHHHTNCKTTRFYFVQGVLVWSK